MATPRASFYFNVRRRDHALCQLIDKALRQGLAIGVAADSEADVHALDLLLWEVPPTGFLPHCKVGHALADVTPVLLDHRLDRLPQRDVLFNWRHDIAADPQRFGRVIEIVARDDEIGREAARQRVAAYKRAGFTVDFTDMATR
ncbi:DNA polymerase III subunit chi [Chitinimonas lacunae]|uniref:DNA polymerase III subunit chi n=1 Tax=Chitinimonas lacunae TaxID=1963018 RepID=A0ABV8MVK1_9NEIS